MNDFHYLIIAFLIAFLASFCFATALYLHTYSGNILMLWNEPIFWASEIIGTFVILWIFFLKENPTS